MCVGFGCVDVPPSPNAQLYDNGAPSGSAEPALENATARGAWPVEQSHRATALRMSQREGQIAEPGVLGLNIDIQIGHPGIHG